ncbi:endonuclease/exonuclease/phosphatase family protein [Streptomyces pseudovenezuelae]|uniref:Endonuclease/exonuclease/phosphatase family metal-dependent hydrolase n=1 Tax=Streptomyces pseudovenezuelae TaxID=67350 RepID=A0ABT6M0Y2_9ACTN|nr:endonuclease/exonuclease/phosphatase family protein [Streptomyces pseudovenezuelae]MDH6222215.1 endonuclease/exonuclease/phosphatase family metal-dependent hydrolase [Streptomyces pseudovenezuelae]
MTQPPENDEFRVVTWKVEHNGISNNGDDARWHLAMDVLATLQPHVLLRQELTRADMFGGRAIWAESARLGGHAAFLASANPESANPTGAYVDRDLCRPAQYFEHRTGMWHSVCNPVVRLKGTARTLSLASVHLCPFDPAMRASEARRLATLGRPGVAAIVGGDMNSYSHRLGSGPALPDWSQITDRAHFEARTIERNGKRISDTLPDEILSGEHGGRPPVFVELGHYAATELGLQGALEPTASLWRTDQGPRQRIDRFYATPQVARALTGLEVVVTEEVIEASDHPPVLATFSLSALRRALSADPALAPAASPWNTTERNGS